MMSVLLLDASDWSQFHVGNRNRGRTGSARESGPKRSGLGAEGYSTPVVWRDPIPDWKTMVGKYDCDGDGYLSKDEFPSDLAIQRRVYAGSTPGAARYRRHSLGGSS